MRDLKLLVCFIFHDTSTITFKLLTFSSLTDDLHFFFSTVVPLLKTQNVIILFFTSSSSLYRLQSSFFLQSLCFLLQPSPSAPTVFYPLQWPGPALPPTSSWGMKMSTFLSITPGFTCSCQLHIGSLVAKKQVFYLLSSKWPYPVLWRRGVHLQLPAGYGEQGQSLVAGRGLPLQGVVFLGKIFLRRS